MSTSDRPTPTLLGICEDIRKIIYELVLQDAEPRIRVSLEDKSRQDTLTNFIEDPTRPANEYWRESSPPKLQAVINGNELLLTCKQVYGELHKTFHRSTVLQVHQSVLCHPYMKALRKAFSKVQAIYIADDQDSDGDDVLIGTVCSIPQPRGTAIILLDIHEVAMEMLWTAQDLHTDRLPQLFRCKKEIAMNGFANGTSHIESQHLHRYLPSAKKFSLASRQLVRIVGRAAVVYILDIGYALERPRAVRLDCEERYSAVVAVVSIPRC